MRVLTVISGIVMSMCGAFLFAFSGNLFSSVAFVIGVTMVISGACNIGAYLISGRGRKRLTETTLVEGLVTLLYGVAVLNNQVTDAFLTMFFGTWLTLCGVTRVSQSFYVSRFNPKDWAKIIPLAVMASMMGVVMMMPKILIAVAPLILVGGSFIFVGLSILTYAMFMKQKTIAAEGEIKAKERAVARKEMARVEREERDRLRNLSKHERAEELAIQKKEKEEADRIKKAAIEAQKAARRQAARPEIEKTIEIPDKQVEQINAIADEKIAQESGENPMTAIWETMAKENQADSLSQATQTDIPIIPEAPQTRAAWQKPVDIPKLKQEAKEPPKETVKEEQVSLDLKAVKLDDIETKSAAVEFEKIELPKFTFATELEMADRKEVLQGIKQTTIENETIGYSPITLEDLVNEPLSSAFDLKDAKRFTQTLNFGWLEAEEKK